MWAARVPAATIVCVAVFCAAAVASAHACDEQDVQDTTVPWSRWSGDSARPDPPSTLERVLVNPPAEQTALPDAFNLTLAQMSIVSARTGHSAFPDLIRHKGRLLASMREATCHVCYDGNVRVMQADPHGGEKTTEIAVWRELAMLHVPEWDLRDPHFAELADGSLMLVMGVRIGQVMHNTSTAVSFSQDAGSSWTEPVLVTQHGRWIWRAARSPVDDLVYGVEYRLGTYEQDHNATLMRTHDGLAWHSHTRLLDTQGAPMLVTEVALAFVDKAGYLLLRSDELDLPARAQGGAYLARSLHPYLDWTYVNVAINAGGPVLLPLRIPGLAGMRFLAAGRDTRFVGSCFAPQTAIWEVDPATGAWRHLMWLPSVGDASYPGLVYEPDSSTLLAVYYSQIGDAYHYGVYAAKLSLQLSR